MSVAVRISQELDANGEPAPMVFVEHIRQAKALQTWPDAVMRFLRGLNPSRTGVEGVYDYRDPGRGSGRLWVEGATSLQLSRIDELVHMEEIERVIGMKDPNRQEDLQPYLTPFVLKTRNPYIQMAFGLFGVFAGVAIVVSFYTTMRDQSWGMTIALFVIAVLLFALGAILAVRGFRRLRWWHAARAQAIRDGGPIPEELHFIG